jgi:drug/metabolite transporter (DMT)-like permease
MLGEWIGWHRILAICVGFTGVLFVTRPGFGNIHWAVSFSLLATLSYALYILWTRYLARFDSARTTLVNTPLAGAVFPCICELANAAGHLGLVGSSQLGVARRVGALAPNPPA